MIMNGILEIIEPVQTLKVVADVDVCVIGGSCTGVFAAVRAARLGAKVALIEKQNCFGGMATAGMVNIWHSLHDTEEREQIIGGLTDEIVERLNRRGAALLTPGNPDAYCRFNSEELKIELDSLISDHNIAPMLHTWFCRPIVTDNVIQAVIVENKSGRQAVKAKVFIDASGDGDLAARLELPFTESSSPQAPTTCARIANMHLIPGLDPNTLINTHGKEVDLGCDTGWSALVPDSPTDLLYALTHVFGTDAVDAMSLSHAEMAGRRHVRAFMDLVKKYYPGYPISLSALGSSIGIRESRHFRTIYRLTEQDLLTGRNFDDTIANGSYRIDVHEGDGFTFKYLNGSTVTISAGKTVRGRWREETTENPLCYHIPFRTMIFESMPNLVLAGRAINLDRGAFGAVRVMVNLNQTGEAAGVAAALAAASGIPVNHLETGLLRQTMVAGGSILFD